MTALFAQREMSVLMEKIEALKWDLRVAWSGETSNEPLAWSPANPSLGQCAVTALLVQDQFGGEIVWSEVLLPNGKRISHYFNRLSDSDLVLDLTREQFPVGTFIPDGVPKTKGFPTTRDYVLSFDITTRRYNSLRDAYSLCTETRENRIKSQTKR
jgi:hypothetical protein